MRASFLLPLAVAVLGYAIVSLVGSMLTDIGPWYRALVKPSWQPPDWLFGPVWTTIFILAAVSAALAWRAAGETQRRMVVILFVANGILNVGWSLLFFHLKQPLLAGIEVILLWASIVALIWYLQRFSRPAAWLLVPYLLWVSFATVLNWTIVALNP
jgi:tryptophan-rich sensory protein